MVGDDHLPVMRGYAAAKYLALQSPPGPLWPGLSCLTVACETHRARAMQDRYVLVLVGVIIITFLTFHQEICKAPFMPHLTDPEPPPLPPMLMQSKRQLLPDMDAEAPPATDVPSPTDPAPQLPPDPPPTGALLPLGPSLLLYKPTTAPMWDPTFVPRWQHLVSIPIMRSRHSMRLLDLCITSILYMTPYPKFDVLIMLDPPSRALIRKSFLEGRLEALNAQYLMVPDPIYVDDFYTGKYWWVDWPMLTQVSQPHTDTPQKTRHRMLIAPWQPTITATPTRVHHAAKTTWKNLCLVLVTPQGQPPTPCLAGGPRPSDRWETTFGNVQQVLWPFCSNYRMRSGTSVPVLSWSPLACLREDPPPPQHTHTQTHTKQHLVADAVM